MDKAKEKRSIVIEYPKLSMWQLIVEKKIPPTRIRRYCCETFKEHGGKGRMKITGVRWAESVSRRKNNDVVKIIGKPATTKKTAEKWEWTMYRTQKAELC